MGAGGCLQISLFAVDAGSTSHVGIHFYPVLRRVAIFVMLGILDHVSAVEGLDHWIREKLEGTGEAHPVTPP